MSSWRRTPTGCLRRDGTPKVALGKRRAVALARRLRLRPYKCDVCHRWHLTSQDHGTSQQPRRTLK